MLKSMLNDRTKLDPPRTVNSLSHTQHHPACPAATCSPGRSAATLADYMYELEWSFNIFTHHVAAPAKGAQHAALAGQQRIWLIVF
jgi:hypothetical protein